jgi:hypothetical protein
MAKTADVLLMNLYSGEHDNDNTDRDFATTTASIINLLNIGEIDDDAIVNLLLNHHHQPDKARKAARALAFLCFNRLTTLRALNEQLKSIKGDAKEFIQDFCFEFCKSV